MLADAYASLAREPVLGWKHDNFYKQNKWASIMIIIGAVCVLISTNKLLL